MSPPKTEYFPFKGGLDLETPALSLGKGSLIGCQNYECDIQGGYRRIDGYERFDGRVLPSEAKYHILAFDDGLNEVFQDDRIIGASSSATGRIVDVVVESGSWLGNDAVGYFVFLVETGTFIDNEELTHYTSDAFSSGFSSGFQ